MRALYLISISFVLLAAAARAETIVPGGPVTGTWTQSGSPYVITGEIAVPNGETLTIEPGVDVTFAGHYKFRVQGRLLAVGTAVDSIRFSASDPETGWHGIRFENTPAQNDSSLIVYCRLEHGRAQGDYPDYMGGAAYIDGFDRIRIAHCTFRGNTAAHGGGVVCTSGGIIADNRFISNVATGAFGYEGAGSGLHVSGATAVIGNTLRDNWASDGGATVILRGSALLQNNVICDNDGQGVYCYPDCSSRIVNNTVCANTGTGIRCGYDSAPEIVGCAICDNADSGLWFSLSFATVINCTISGNAAQHGGGVFCSESDPVFMNCILWGNTAVSGSQVYLHSYFLPSVNPDFFHCDIEGGVDAFGMYPGLSYEGRYDENIDLAPCFESLPDHPYALTEQSYCINAGRMDIEGLGLPATDLSGAPRIYDAFRVDMGAYEYQGSPAFVDMPLFTPTPGWYPDPQAVTLDCPTPDAAIHYTLDGSEPTQESPLYSDPLPITTHTTIRAKAFHTTLPSSLISTGTFRIGSDLGGVISGALPLEHSPYFIVEDLEIPIGQTLIMEPGIEFIFMDHYRLDVQGRLLAVGTPACGIQFKADDPGAGWAGIRFDETSAVNDSSRLEYCVIEHGWAYGASPADHGGGIYVGSFSKLLVTHCRIWHCTATRGGGIACDYGASPRILENVLEVNVATQRGGGLYCGSGCAPAIRGNIFSVNSAAQGGGLTAFACGAATGPIRIEHNTFSGNQAVAGGGLIPAGGAMYIYDGGAIIHGNLVTGNTSADYGAGIHVERADVEISSNVVGNNICQQAGGGIVCYVYSRGRMVNNLIYGNHADAGGGLFLSYGDQWEIINNTICDNSAVRGGGFLMTGYDARLMNCILWGNDAPDGPQIAIFGQPNLEVTYCDVQGGRGEIGGDAFQPYLTYTYNIDADPEFVLIGEHAYAPGETSPCVDVGVPDTTGLHLPAHDLAGNPRIVNDWIDMGAYEFQGVAVIDDHGAAGIRDGVVFALGQHRPNPFRSGTRIAFSVPAGGHILLTVYDVSGRCVRTLIDAVKPAGTHVAAWDGRDEQGHRCAAGVYLSRLEANGRSASRRLILLR